ncbi:MAG: hypothetical protein IPF66_10705 [Holophagales bacterium]|nr:hypothetical protein [Holophagales bacterium]
MESELALLELPSAAPTVLFIALLLQGIAFLGLAAVVLFDLLLPGPRCGSRASRGTSRSASRSWPS